MKNQRAFLPAMIAAVVLVPAGAWAVCTNQTAQSNYACNTQSQVYASLPCGATLNDHGQCFRIHTAQFGCTFALGDWGTEEFILVWWERKPGDPKPPPSFAECKALEESIPTCGPQETWYSPGCPDVVVSDEGCTFGCEPFTDGSDRGLAENAEKLDRYGWNEPCRAYALMPRSWRQDPWAPAEGFFTIGRPFPTAAIPWMVGDEHYGAIHALAEGRLGPTTLGVVGTTPLWGGEDGFVNPKQWWQHAQEAGVCVNERGALLASPYWTAAENILPGGMKSFPVLVNCDGSSAALEGFSLREHWPEWDAEQWAASGARAADVLPRLKRLARRSGLDLVCVTPELAQERRQQRRQKPNELENGKSSSD